MGYIDRLGGSIRSAGASVTRGDASTFLRSLIDSRKPQNTEPSARVLTTIDTMPFTAGAPAAQIYSLAAVKQGYPNIEALRRSSSEPDFLPEACIEMEPLNVDEGFWDDYDIRSARILGADHRSSLFRIEAHAWEETVTLYGRDGKVIAKWDEDAHLVGGGVNWSPSYPDNEMHVDAEAGTLKLRDGPISLSVDVRASNGEPLSDQLNRVVFTRTERFGYNPYNVNQMGYEQSETVHMMAITDDEAFASPDRRMPDPKWENRPEDFSDEGNIGYYYSKSKATFLDVENGDRPSLPLPDKKPDDDRRT